MAARLARFVVNTRVPLSPARMQSTAVAGNATEKLDIGTRIIAGASLLWCSSVLGTVSHLVVVALFIASMQLISIIQCPWTSVLPDRLFISAFCKKNCHSA